MTNTQIITDTIKAAFTPEQIAQLTAAIFAPDQIAEKVQIGMAPAEILGGAFHTFQEWKRLGYSVKKGEHAALVAYLWKFTDRPSKAQREAAEAEGKEAEAGENRFYKAKSFLFCALQVEKIQK